MDEQTPKGPGGRPTKYKPEYCEQLIEFMKKGYSFELFALEVKVTKKTLYEWTRANPEFLHAKELAWLESQKYYEDVGIEHRTNIKDGPSLNNVWWVMNMKNRFGWRDRVEHKEAQKDDFATPDNLLAKP